MDQSDTEDLVKAIESFAENENGNNWNEEEEDGKISFYEKAIPAAFDCALSLIVFIFYFFIFMKMEK